MSPLRSSGYGDPSLNQDTRHYRTASLPNLNEWLPCGAMRSLPGCFFDMLRPRWIFERTGDADGGPGLASPRPGLPLFELTSVNRWACQHRWNERGRQLRRPYSSAWNVAILRPSCHSSMAWRSTNCLARSLASLSLAAMIITRFVMWSWSPMK